MAGCKGDAKEYANFIEVDIEGFNKIMDVIIPKDKRKLLDDVIFHNDQESVSVKPTVFMSATIIYLKAAYPNLAASDAAFIKLMKLDL